jgi:hypothetical protein
MLEGVVASPAEILKQQKIKYTTIGKNLKIPTGIFKECRRTAYSWGLDRFTQIGNYKWRNDATNMEIDLPTLVIFMWQGGMINRKTGKLKEKYER